MNNRGFKYLTKKMDLSLILSAENINRQYKTDYAFSEPVFLENCAVLEPIKVTFKNNS